jgi:hypothetical protein
MADKQGSMKPAEKTAGARYSQLETTRTPFLLRAREASRLTIPSLYPPLGHTGATLLPTPYQGVGARGVNNLSARLLLTLFQPNAPFFKLSVSEYALKQAAGGQTDQNGNQVDIKAQIDVALSQVERDVMRKFETSAMRPTIAEALKHAVVAGNVLIFMKPDDGLRYYNLENFVCRRDPSGTVLEIIARDMVSWDTLPLAVKKLFDKTNAENDSDAEEGQAPADQPDSTSGERSLALYTHICRKDRHWKVYQELKGKIIPGSEGNYPLDKSPWIPIRWTKIDNEDYGRGFVEEYQGDLQSLEGLAQAVVEGAAASAKYLVLVNPNGLTKIKLVSEAPNGAVRAGRKEDVEVVQANKGGDLAVASNTAKNIEQRLEACFLLNSAVQRNGERVTAEEIRYMAQELETTLGGLYSILAHEFQLPFVTRLMLDMERKKELPVLPHKLVKPTIVTGLEALGRGNDLSCLEQFLQTLSQNMTPQWVAARVNGDELTKRVASATNIDPTGLIKSDAQVQQEQQQQQQQEMMRNMATNAVPNGVKAVGDLASNAQTSAIQQQQQPQQGANG